MASVDQEAESHDTAVGFACQILNTRPIIDTLAGVHNGKNDQHANCIADSDGITFKVQDLGNNVQGLASLTGGMLAEIALDNAEQVQFKINIAVLLQCLSIYGSGAASTTATTMDYNEGTAEFRLVLQGSGGVVTECSIRTLEAAGDAFGDDPNDLFAALNESKVSARAIMLSETLSDALCEIYNLPGATILGLVMSPEYPYFQLTATGNTASCTIEFPKGSESFKSFQCETEVEFQYQLSLVQHALRVLPTASQTQIRVSDDGLLCFQHRLQHKGGEMSYVEFVILPEESLGDENLAEEMKGEPMAVPPAGMEEGSPARQRRGASEDAFEFESSSQEARMPQRRLSSAGRRKKRRRMVHDESSGAVDSDDSVIGPSQSEGDASSGEDSDGLFS